MKNFYLLTFSLLFIQITTHSQSCLPEGITFTTQEEIDNFQTNHPGCTEIGGGVFIGSISGTDVSNLNGLSVLTAINGGTWIQWNDNLSSLTGLDNLTTIGEDFWIFDNDMLINLTGLDNLTTIGDDFVIERNDVLTNLSGLTNLNTIGNDFLIKLNPNISSLDDLNSLSNIGGDVSIISNSASLKKATFSGIFV